MENCPSCAKPFYHISDYPVVRISRLDTVKIKGKLKLVGHVLGIHGRGENLLPIPQEVPEMFKTAGIPPDAKGYIKVKETIWEQIPQPKPVEVIYFRKNIFRDKQVQKHIGKYVSDLELLIGQEVKQQNVLPPEKWNRIYDELGRPYYWIPNTDKLLAIHGNGFTRLDVVKPPRYNYEHVATVGELVYEGKLLPQNT